jgi:hypothetical protein
LPLALLCLLTAFRLWYAATHGMANDETYYWQWSRHLAWGYYDQGPGIAFCIRLGTSIVGDTALGVRLVPILLAAVTGWLTYRTAELWLGGRIALWSLGLLSVAPLLSVGGILATYDNPQVFCWVASLYALTRTVQENRAGGWYVVGLFVGLGALCKLTAWLFAPCVLVFLLLSPTQRRWLQTPYPYLGFVLALLIYSPCLLWNLHHDFPSMRHAAALSSRSRGAAPFRWFGEFLGGQAIVLGPFLFLAELWVIGRLTVSQIRPKAASLAESEAETQSNIRTPLFAEPDEDCGAGRLTTQRPNHPATEWDLFLLAFCAPILLLCLGISLQSKMEANWPAPAHLTGLMVVAVWFVALWKKAKGPGRFGVASASGISAVLVGILLFPEIVPAVGIHVSAELAQKANETYGWAELMTQVQVARKTLEAEGKPVFLAGINYRVPSLLAFYLPDRPEAKELFLAARRDQYFYAVDSAMLVGQNCLLCLDSDKEEAVALARTCFASVEALPVVEVYRPGFSGPAKRWQLYACRDFKGYSPTDHVEGW